MILFRLFSIGLAIIGVRFALAAADVVDVKLDRLDYAFVAVVFMFFAHMGLTVDVARDQVDD